MGSEVNLGVYLFQVTRPVQSLGVQEELLLVSLVLEVVVLIALARVLLEMYPFSPKQVLNFSYLNFYERWINAVYTCTDGVICVWLCDQWQLPAVNMLAHMADEQ